MPPLFQPSPPPCANGGTTTVLTPAFEEGQRVFAVRCPACGRAGTYTLDYSALASGEPDHGAASVARFNLGTFCPDASSRSFGHWGGPHGGRQVSAPRCGMFTDRRGCH